MSAATATKPVFAIGKEGKRFPWAVWRAIADTERVDLGDGVGPIFRLAGEPIAMGRESSREEAEAAVRAIAPNATATKATHISMYRWARAERDRCMSRAASIATESERHRELVTMVLAMPAALTAREARLFLIAIAAKTGCGVSPNCRSDQTMACVVVRILRGEFADFVCEQTEKLYSDMHTNAADAAALVLRSTAKAGA